jgi:hypothetical protein
VFEEILSSQTLPLEGGNVIAICTAAQRRTMHFADPLCFCSTMQAISRICCSQAPFGKRAEREQVDFAASLVRCVAWELINNCSNFGANW